VHVAPEYPLTHAQENPVDVTVQAPPFLQGCASQTDT